MVITPFVGERKFFSGKETRLSQLRMKFRPVKIGPIRETPCIIPII